MARPHRNFTTDNRFHIINRAVDDQDLFSIDDDWKLFESLIGKACLDYDFTVNAYALMSNHYHLLADLSTCTRRSEVSDAIGTLQSTYAKYFNDRTERRGPLFEPRFLAFGVSGDARIHRVVRYIHRNPIDICGRRALGSYRWSSLPVVLGRRESPSWLDCSHFAADDPSTHLADLANCALTDLRPLDDLPPQRLTTLETVIDAVDIVGGPTLEPGVRNGIVAWWCLEHRAADIVEVANRLGCGVSNVRKSAHRIRMRRRDEHGFERLLERVSLEILRR